MTTEQKVLSLGKYYPGIEISPIETKKFNGVWFNIDGFEHVVLSNEERYHASNNIVIGDVYDAFKDMKEYPEITVYSVG